MEDTKGQGVGRVREVLLSRIGYSSMVVVVPSTAVLKELRFCCWHSGDQSDDPWMPGVGNADSDCLSGDKIDATLLQASWRLVAGGLANKVQK